MKTLSIKVRANARNASLQALADGTWMAHVKAAPVDGKANAELIALVAAHFSLRRSQVVIKSGGAGRSKLVQIDV